VFAVDVEKNERQSGSVAVRKFLSKGLEFPYPCEIKKATHALMAAFEIEMNSHNPTEDALPYYELAVKLCDKEFYKTMLENYQKCQMQK
jgi:hypothetical protein